MSSSNKRWGTDPWEAARRLRSLFAASYALGLRQMILGPSWWLSAGPHLCTTLACLEQEREPEQEQGFELER